MLTGSQEIFPTKIFRYQLESHQDLKDKYLKDMIKSYEECRYDKPNGWICDKVSTSYNQKLIIKEIPDEYAKIVDGLMLEGKLKGHKFSDRKYTLYSMRSTFIEDHLIKRTDLYLLARVSGHSVTTLMESYERLDIRQRAQELTTIEYGKGKSPEPQVINLFDS